MMGADNGAEVLLMAELYTLIIWFFGVPVIAMKMMCPSGW